jgi:hypothetical protein
MSDYTDAIAMAAEDAANKEFKDNTHKLLLLEIEAEFVRYEKANNPNEVDFILLTIAELAAKIWDTRYRDAVMGDFAKKYMGKKSEYKDRIKPLISLTATPRRKSENPIRYHQDTHSITFWNGSNETPITEDFLINILYQLKDEYKETRWVLELKRKHDRLVVEVTNDEFSSSKDLKKMLLTERLSLIITDTQLPQLHAFLLKQQIKQGKKIKRIGYDADVDGYIFGNGCWKNGELYRSNENGIIEIGEKVVSMPIVNQEEGDRHWFRYIAQKEHDLNFADFYSAMCKAYTSDTASHCIHHYLLAIYRDIVIDAVKFSPLILLKGAASSGKTSLARLLTALFGVPQPTGSINLKSTNTKVGISRELSKYSNYLLVMEELDPTNKDNKSAEEVLQSCYDNSSGLKAKENKGNFNTGLETDTNPVKSAVLITSNFFPESQILFTRCVYIPMNNQRKTDEQRKYYEGYLKQYEGNGMSYITAHLQQYRGYVRDQFWKEYQKAFKAIQALVQAEQVVDRLIYNQAVLTSLALIINRKEKMFAGSLSDEQHCQVMYENAAKQIMVQHNEMTENGVLKTFFDILQELYDKGQFKEFFHYKREYNTGEGEIVLRVKLIYNSLFKPYYLQKYRTIPPDRTALEGEMAKFLGLDSPQYLYGDRDNGSKKGGKNFMPPKLEGKINFGQDSVKHKMIPYYDCVVMPYNMLQSKFHIDFNFWSEKDESDQKF